MRTFFICIVIVLLTIAGYAYVRNPAGCMEIVHDFGVLYQSLVGAKLGSGIVDEISHSAPVTVSAPTAPPLAPAPLSLAPLLPLPPSPLKKYVPPSIVPQKLNWTWVCGGSIYENVVITGIKSDSVSITHSSGTATIPIELAPPEVQQALNYDAAAVSAAKAELARETSRPYYDFASLAEARRVARQLHWPLAWMEVNWGDQNTPHPSPNSGPDLTQMAINRLKSQSVLILLNGNNDLLKLSPILREQQFFQMDDGPVPGGHHFIFPKIVFSDASVRQAFGRVSETQMAASREASIDAVFQTIARDPSDQYLLNNQPAETGPPPK